MIAASFHHVKLLLAAVVVLCMAMAPFAASAGLACDTVQSASAGHGDHGHPATEGHEPPDTARAEADTPPSGDPERADDHCSSHLCFYALSDEETGDVWILQQVRLEKTVASLVNAATDGPRRPPRA